MTSLASSPCWTACTYSSPRRSSVVRSSERMCWMLVGGRAGVLMCCSACVLSRYETSTFRILVPFAPRGGARRLLARVLGVWCPRRARAAAGLSTSSVSRWMRIPLVPAQHVGGRPRRSVVLDVGVPVSGSVTTSDACRWGGLVGSRPCMPAPAVPSGPGRMSDKNSYRTFGIAQCSCPLGRGEHGPRLCTPPPAGAGQPRSGVEFEDVGPAPGPTQKHNAVSRKGVYGDLRGGITRPYCELSTGRCQWFWRTGLFEPSIWTMARNCPERQALYKNLISFISVRYKSSVVVRVKTLLKSLFYYRLATPKSISWTHFSITWTHPGSPKSLFFRCPNLSVGHTRSVRRRRRAGHLEGGKMNSAWWDHRR